MNITEKRPKLLILGYARHGKDSVAEIMRDLFGLKFISSSVFCGQEALWNQWGIAKYSSFDEMFEDRHNHRVLWMEMISAYNTPNKTRTAKTMFERGYDLYVGMRRQDELDACREANCFDKVIWVDRPDYPVETGSMDITKESAKPDFIISNDGTLEDLTRKVGEVIHQIHLEGFIWRIEEPINEATVAKIPQSEEVDLLVIPEGAKKVLDHGYVALMDVFGSDDDIVEAARLSYGRGTSKKRDNTGLIRYLYSHHHTSPFEMAELKFQMRLPIFVMRQLVRHRTANLNEYSGRYSEMPRLFYVPNVEDIKGQSTINKQGSEGVLPEEQATIMRNEIISMSEAAFDLYQDLLDQKMSREMARIVLPLNTYTEIVWKMDLNNMLKFLWLRDDGHAQPEIRVYAQAIAEAVQMNFPKTYAAYLESRESVTLSKKELYAILTGDRSTLSKSETAKSFALQEELNDWIKRQFVNQYSQP